MPFPVTPTMRAKMRLAVIEKFDTSERLRFHCVARNDAYPADGSDENNTFAKFSPSGELTLTVANPALIGEFTPGEEYYLDFTLATPAKVAS